MPMQLVSLEEAKALGFGESSMQISIVPSSRLEKSSKEETKNSEISQPKQEKNLENTKHED